jgi:uncharacterized protein YlaN (UPF0358 family)
MWEDLPSESIRPPTDAEINHKYAKREVRIVTETNREQLPNFVAALKRTDWINLQPFYQRRLRWDDERKSKLIESFIMNIPVPPCFLYESEFARYEVMDGQQRISTIWDFYDNKFKLKNLEQWPELNGRIYDKLPSEIKKGLDRRSLSYTVLLKESAQTRDEELLLRQQVFERLNTGGVALVNQEIRHCIYHSAFDDLLFELARHPTMRRAFGLIPYSKDEDINPPSVLLNNPHYTKMRDVEFVLRIFALRHAQHYRGGMQSFLDQYMVRSRRFDAQDISTLRHVFVTALELAHVIYGTHLFRPWNPKTQHWSPKPQIAYADTIMVGLSDRLDKAERLQQLAAEVVEATKQMVLASDPKAFTGQRNTKADVVNRIGAYKNMLDAVLT